VVEVRRFPVRLHCVITVSKLSVTFITTSSMWRPVCDSNIGMATMYARRSSALGRHTRIRISSSGVPKLSIDASIAIPYVQESLINCEGMSRLGAQVKRAMSNTCLRFTYSGCLTVPLKVSQLPYIVNRRDPLPTIPKHIIAAAD
jgi:hypothetical protein